MMPLSLTDVGEENTIKKIGGNPDVVIVFTGTVAHFGSNKAIKYCRLL